MLPFSRHIYTRSCKNPQVLWWDENVISHDREKKEEEEVLSHYVGKALVEMIQNHHAAAIKSILGRGVYEGFIFSFLKSISYM